MATLASSALVVGNAWCDFETALHWLRVCGALATAVPGTHRCFQAAEHLGNREGREQQMAGELLQCLWLLSDAIEWACEGSGLSGQVPCG